MFFSRNGSQNPIFWYDILCALVLRTRLARVAPTTTLGIALSHFRECLSITGGGEQCSRLSESLSFLRSCRSKSQIWKTSDFHPGEFTAPLLRWCTHTPGNSLGQPLVVLWRLCASMRAERETRTSSQKILGRRGILRIVFGKKHAFFGDFKILIS